MSINNGKAVFVWGDGTLAISNFDPMDGFEPYAQGCVAITQHYDGFEMAGSLEHGTALFLDGDQVKGLIKALQEFVEDC